MIVSNFDNYILGRTHALDQIEMKPCISGIWAEVHHKCWGAGQKVQSEKHGDYGLRSRIYICLTLDFPRFQSQLSQGLECRQWVGSSGNHHSALRVCPHVLYQGDLHNFYFTKSLTIENILLRNFTFNIESLTQQVIFLWQESKSVAMKKYDYVKVNETFPPKKCGPG